MYILLSTPRLVGGKTIVCNCVKTNWGRETGKKSKGQTEQRNDGKKTSPLSKLKRKKNEGVKGRDESNLDTVVSIMYYLSSAGPSSSVYRVTGD